MDDGLMVDEKQFMKMKPAERDLIIYRNLRAVCAQHEAVKFHQKVQYILIAAAMGGIGILFKIALKI